MIPAPQPPRNDAEAAKRLAAMYAEQQVMLAYMARRTAEVERPGTGNRRHSQAKNCLGMELGYSERLTRLFPVGDDL